MKEEINVEVKRHSLSHIMAAAVKELWPSAKLAIGPAIENGFYYDIDFDDVKIVESDLKNIEKKMSFMIKQNLKFERSEKNIDEALKEMEASGDVYKHELISELKDQGETTVSFYQVGNFSDLCRGPHIENTNQLTAGSYKLNKLAGAYWRGDEKRKMLTRIYGLAFDTKEELDEHLRLMAEAEKRDHKKLGRELDLFSFHPEAPGFAFWHEKGMIIWNELERLGKSIRQKYGYVEIKTPQMAKNSLWITSGHWDHYKEDMFVFDVDKETYCLKPMDCPFNIKIYQTRQRSYRELPIRYTEIGRVFRNEKSGQLNGLLRVREISQDDSHLFITENQIKQEVGNLLEMVFEFYSKLGITPEFFLSTRPDDFMGDIKTWDKAENDLIEILKEKNINYKLKEKDGAFYGPKIDVNLNDALKRSWQVATIQLDFQLPGRFDCEYVDADGSHKTPVLVHAAVFGSFERMTGILVEHYGGAFPLWLSPVQVRFLSVSENHIAKCDELYNEFKNLGVRVEIDDSNETLGNKIRKAAAEKIPYVVVIGDKESNSSIVSVRNRGEQNITEHEKDDFIKKIVEDIKNHK